MTDEAPSVLPAALAGLLRQLLTALGTLLVSKGVISDDLAPMLVGGALAVAAFAWSMIHKAGVKAAIQAAIDAPAGFAK